MVICFCLACRIRRLKPHTYMRTSCGLGLKSKSFWTKEQWALYKPNQQNIGLNKEVACYFGLDWALDTFKMLSPHKVSC